MHRCDLRCCVNPDHLQLGTRKDNVMDAVKKRRNFFELSWDDVCAIRGSTEKTGKLTARYGVSRHHVWAIRRGLYRRQPGA